LYTSIHSNVTPEQTQPHTPPSRKQLSTNGRACKSALQAQYRLPSKAVPCESVEGSSCRLRVLTATILYGVAQPTPNPETRPRRQISRCWRRGVEWSRLGKLSEPRLVTEHESWSAFDRFRGLDASVGLQCRDNDRTGMSRWAQACRTIINFRFVDLGCVPQHRANPICRPDLLPSRRHILTLHQRDA
jgi:hypothetical protein